jgi:hypothetical protein
MDQVRRPHRVRAGADWPRSVGTYKQMRADSQVSALFKATMLGVMKFKWSIDPNGCDERWSEQVQHRLQPADPRRQRSSSGSARSAGSAFKDHMRKAFYAGIYGHYYFEQVGKIQDDGLWHLRKLAERPPRTIQDFRIAEDGGLISIIQNIPKGGAYWGDLPEIPVDRLVGYVWEQEGANWAGKLLVPRLLQELGDQGSPDPHRRRQPRARGWRPVHRGASGRELRGDRTAERDGPGLPDRRHRRVAPSRTERSSSSRRAPTVVVIESIKYHDEAMARKWMLMIMQLGMTESGSRALGKPSSTSGATVSRPSPTGSRTPSTSTSSRTTWTGTTARMSIKVPLLTYEYDPEFVITDLNGIDSASSRSMTIWSSTLARKWVCPRRARDRGTPNDPTADQKQTTKWAGTAASSRPRQLGRVGAKVLPPVPPARAWQLTILGRRKEGRMAKSRGGGPSPRRKLKGKSSGNKSNNKLNPARPGRAD